MFVLNYLDEPQGKFDTLNLAIAQVRRNYEDWNANPNLRTIPGGFPFSLYEIFQTVDVDLRSIITTNHRGTFPKSWRAEGENFVD